jgi:hypothetical protein
MPAIAAGVQKEGASFYWHLGDFRAIYDFDEDISPPAELRLATPHLSILDYLTRAWTDFIEKQLNPFGNMELFLGIGNHEVIYPKTREDYLVQFGSYLDGPRIRAQRELDKDTGALRTYYHWVINNSIDFISLDNANNTFDAAQLTWLRARLAEDAKNGSIKTLIVGMHEALPGSKGMSHSMCDSPEGIAHGRDVYNMLWNLQQAGKKVYLLASHSHFVMDDVYNTPYWGSKVLPGWIVGTAGAVRYRIPKGQKGATIARTDVYGYLTGIVMDDGSVKFDFHEVTRDDLKAANAGKSNNAVIDWCYDENHDTREPTPAACGLN